MKIDIMEEKLHVCDIPIDDVKVNPFTIVIFGGAGDLSKRKLMPTLFHIFKRGKLPEKFTIIGFGRQMDIDDIRYREVATESIKKFSNVIDDELLQKFCSHLRFQAGSFDNSDAFLSLKSLIGESAENEVLFYLSVPSKLYGIVVENLGKVGLNSDKKRTKIIIEKPFGRDHGSSKALSQLVGTVFDEEQVYRMDHYLGKETVQNIMFFRFSNSIFEPLWNRRYIDNVQITVAEDIGIEHRGRFYEQTGVIRDIVQNHILQIIALVAMEPPVAIDADYIRDEKVKIFNSIRKIDESDDEKMFITGQYGRKGDIKGYREEDAVAGDSNVPTFFAGKFFIDNWRWAGVPFYVRTGKRLKKKKTEIVIQFRQPPLKLFDKSCKPLDSNNLILTIQPREKITFDFGVKYPESSNMLFPVQMGFCYDDYFKSIIIPPYERLIFDCLRGDQMLFVRQDGVEAMWEIVDPIIGKVENDSDDIDIYSAGSWGGKKSDEFIEKDGKKWITK